MSRIPSLTIKLALQIERVIAPEINGTKETRDPTEPIIKGFGQTVASKAISGRPVNIVYCFGQDDHKHLKDILAFYAVDNLNPYFSLTPMKFHESSSRCIKGCRLLPTGFRTNYSLWCTSGYPSRAIFRCDDRAGDES